MSVEAISHILRSAKNNLKVAEERKELRLDLDSGDD